MNRNAIASVLVAALVLLAGCSGGITGSQDGTATDGSTTTAAQSTTAATDSGTLNLYVSDEQNAISDFEHLNVTITRVGLNPADDGGDDTDDEESDDTEESGNETNESDDTENVTETTTETQTESPETETESDDDVESDAEDGEGEWVEYEVDSRTVDLTRLQGANATRLSSFDVPNGTYEKVFVYVSEVNGTLKDGSDQRVKLPSGKLQLNSEFTVGNGESVDFVFDITAVKAGQSGKYVLKPVISESGTDVEIDPVDEDEDDETGEGDADDRGDASEQSAEATAALNASFVGNVTQGENATISVTQNGSAVANATVAVDDDRVGTTDADGTATVSVPDDAEELEVTITRGDAETELTVEFETESSRETQSTTQSSSDGGTSTATS
ncbi:DUF4382 domain-containing protein [Halobellus sp. Atlit-38R]|uniref:DUF4382 domain-containing protein n=1 Tax=Halobellus sp. Atlit-38R TaxID=2282131 RepID=UPI000EF1BCE5|nr:DUF4382 domain-containing protein [Halobellus sp. Atlit-38R]RLM94621.1 DUF4382 domain-containing protein [Halobellus sp. Atlit-38R]